MTKKLEVYKCSICGNIVQVLNSGDGELVCCEQNMELLIPKEEEGELGEKHIPKIITEHTGCETGMCKEIKLIKLDKHPMIEEHYIQIIEAYNNDLSEVRIKFLKPGQKAEYNITDFSGEIIALEYCNIHDLWRNKND